MPNPAGLVAAGRLLLTAGAGPPSEAQLRRAVSTAYYALFHALLGAGATRFMGPGQQARPGYALLYRGYQHGRMRRVCQDLDVAALRPAVARQLGRSQVGPAMRRVAAAFVALQDARHASDYDPAARFDVADVTAALTEAEDAIAAFTAIPPEDQADILALMLVDPRA